MLRGRDKREGTIVAEPEPVRIVLTKEQRELLHRVSGQHVDAIELTPDNEQRNSGPLQFRWRLSASTGIPRQVWDKAESAAPDDAKDK